MRQLSTISNPNAFVGMFPSIFNIGLEQTAPALEDARDHHTLVVKADLPGLIPDEHLKITFNQGMLRIQAKQPVQPMLELDEFGSIDQDRGSLTCDMLLPEGTAASDVHTIYTDGVLQVKVALPKPNGLPTTIPIALKAKLARCESAWPRTTPKVRSTGC